MEKQKQEEQTKNREAFLALAAAIRRSRCVLLTGHVDPDADCIGSLLALCRAFSGPERQLVPVLADPVPPNLHFLPGWESIRRPEELDIQPDAVLLADCSELSRTGDTDWLTPYLARAERVLILDHHANASPMPAEICLQEAEASATAELVYLLLTENDIPIDQETATNLYAGLIADNGSFRFLNTTPLSLRVGSELLAKGIDLETIRVRLFETRSLKSMRIMAAALHEFKTDMDDRLIWMHIEKRVLDELGADSSDCANMTGSMMCLDGVKIGALFEERGPSLVKVSLRARRGFDVGSIAAAFQGGGHKLAAGCSIKAPLAEAEEMVLAACRKALEDADGRLH